jgi:hypothetical protein
MYVAIVPNRNSPPAILLRESFREDGKVKNRTLANLSSWPSERVDALRRLLRGDLDHLVSDTPVCGPVFGQLHALKQIADRLGITAALGRGPMGKLSLFLVLGARARRGRSARASRLRRGRSLCRSG